MASMPFPDGVHGGFQPYPWLGAQPSMPVAVPVQASTAVDSTDASAVHAGPVQTGANQGVSAAVQPGIPISDQQTGSVMGSDAFQSSHGQTADKADRNKLQIVNRLSDRPLGVAACLPKPEKQVSNRSSEDLTARAVAKLWGVNLKRYTGRN